MKVLDNIFSLLCRLLHVVLVNARIDDYGL